MIQAQYATKHWCVYGMQTCYLVHLTHWARVAHICVDNLTIIGSYNGLSRGRREAEPMLEYCKFES